jgi:soluble lytic murein transglycosylase
MLRVLITILCLSATSVMAQNDPRPLASAFTHMKSKNWAAAESVAIKDGQAALDVVLWTKLRAGDGTPAEVLDFLKRNPDWPGLPYLRKQSETIFDGASQAQILSFFGDDVPQTAKGSLIYARALKKAGETSKATLAIQNSWVSHQMDQDTQDAFVREFGAALKDYHETRLINLLWEDAHAAARAMSPLVSDGLQALATARIALRKKEEDVNALIDLVPAKLRDHPVLAHARFEWRLASGYRDSGIELLQQRSKSAVGLGRPQAWASQRERIVRDMLYDGQGKNAYEIAAQHHLTEGDDFAVLEWMAGYIAMTFRNDPKTAIKHFERFLTSVATPISLGRGYYWLGRAHEQAGQPAKATEAYNKGAEHQTSYYGILSAEKVGRMFGQEFFDWSDLPDWRLAEFTTSSVFKAAILLLSSDQLSLGERFLTHLAETLDDQEILQLTDFLEEAQRSHVLVMVGKRAANYGRNFPRPYYALHAMIGMPSRVPIELSLSIARRESEFDQWVVSPVGAMGLMQVMPKTGAEMAANLGVPFQEDKMTSDWQYNVNLGNTYLAELGDRFGGNPVLMAIAYNAGPSRAERWMERLGDPRKSNVDIIDWVELIPFEETRNYVMRVTESIPIYRARLGKDPLPQPFSKMLQGSSLLPFPPESK